MLNKDLLIQESAKIRYSDEFSNYTHSESDASLNEFGEPKMEDGGFEPSRRKSTRKSKSG